ncbi:MAG: hypothetical protein M3R24_18260 [Chloroflexota bacterium]|nr:hypothetical protein [Chloroflexota bacterium]PLS78076.1 MAG: hypothetical protein CYG59_20425 [Chloroflexota bacterium]
MEVFDIWIPLWLLVVGGIILLVLIVRVLFAIPLVGDALEILVFGLFALPIKLFVILREARRPPHLDAGDYRLEQGRDIGADEQRRP